MAISLKRTTSPSSYPVTLARVKEHLRVTWSSEDDLITAYLAAAVNQAQAESNLQFIDATYKLYLDNFPVNLLSEIPAEDRFAIRIPVGPVTAITSVEYIDANGDTQTVSASNYYVGLNTGRIVPAVAWPIVYIPRPESVIVTLQAGWANAAAVPSEIVSAILLMVADKYANRGDGQSQARGLPPAALALLRNVRNDWLFD
jgi:uncharacterized phiE125 gp8 family phage protein